MPKNIVLCSDGTGSASIKDRGSNVFKLFEAIDVQIQPAGSELLTQVAFYDDGVGTEDFKPVKLLGGAFGYGLERNVRQLYTELARVYEPGDRIFLFGFSRGAFTVRTLAGIIGQVGIVDRISAGTDAELERFVKLAFKEHRRCYQRWLSKKLGRKLDPTLADRFRDRYAVKHPIHAPSGQVKIEFLGVWDTVDAVGFPVDEIAQAWNALVYPFKAPDRLLSPQVRAAAHALSIDDERKTFHPVLWDERKETSGRIDQLWFAGVHTNVGGGYPKQGMSLIPLVWMMDQAEVRGLRFVSSVRQLFRDLKNVNDKLYDSRAGIASYYRYMPRDIETACVRNGITPKIHLSVIERIAMGTDAYSPGNLPNRVTVVSRSHPDTAAEATRILGDHSPRLLGDIGKLVFLRQVSHTAVIFVSLAIAALLAWHTIQPVSDGFSTALPRLTKLMSWAGIWSATKAVALAQWWLLVTLGLLLLAAWRLKQRINGIYREFWYKLRPTLRRLFDEPAKAALPAAEADPPVRAERRPALADRAAAS